MAAVDENPFWRDPQLRQMFFDVDLRTGFHRRFFDVGELGGLKQEDWEVFWATHAKVIELVRDGVVDGVRVDHPDGLAEPGRVLRAAAGTPASGTSGRRRSSSRARSCGRGPSRARPATSS